MKLSELYFKKRNNTYYTKFTKEEIYNLIDYKDFQTIIPFLKDMDYSPWENEYYRLLNNCPSTHSPERTLGRFISVMRLAVPRQFGFYDNINP